MIRITKTFPDNSVRTLSLETLESGAWIKLTSPSREEIDAVRTRLGLPEDFLFFALDEEETPRVECDDEAVLVIANVPKKIAENRFDTIPVGMIITKDYFVTVCLEETEALPDMAEGRANRGFFSYKRTRLLFQILYRAASMYLRFVTQINRRAEEIEKRLHLSMRNAEIFELLELEKGLTYFSTSLRTMRSVVQKLQRLCTAGAAQELVKMRRDDEDLLEDVIVEYDQAFEMVQMYSSILSGTMGAFASVISNNLSIVMKFLAAMTITIAMPTMVASFWGMNVPVPFTGYPLGFFAVVGIATGLMLITLLILWHKRMF